MSLPVANSQFYTAAVSSIASMLSPIAQAPGEKEDAFANSISAPATSAIGTPNPLLFELTEEVELILQFE